MSGLLHENGKKILKLLEAKEFPQPEYIHLKYPVLLCHGFGSLASVIKPSPMNDACMLARNHGIAAFAPNITPYHSIKVRAYDWKRIIHVILKKTRAKKINIVAHSMAGLDSRYLISKMEMDRYVNTLTTISTPHHGTSLAEWGLAAPAKVRNLLVEIFNWMGNNIYPKMQSDVLAAIQELTREYVNNEFNKLIPDSKNVIYYSYSAACGKETPASINRFLAPLNHYVLEKEGINDGFVSEQSAHWGTYLGLTSLSHTDQLKINLSSDKEKEWEDFWITLLKRLSKEGH